MALILPLIDPRQTSVTRQAIIPSGPNNSESGKLPTPYFTTGLTAEDLLDAGLTRSAVTKIIRQVYYRHQYKDWLDLDYYDHEPEHDFKAIGDQIRLDIYLRKLGFHGRDYKSDIERIARGHFHHTRYTRCVGDMVWERPSDLWNRTFPRWTRMYLPAEGTRERARCQRWIVFTDLPFPEELRHPPKTEEKDTTGLRCCETIPEIRMGPSGNTASPTPAEFDF